MKTKSLNRIILFVLLMSSVIIFSGCPYSSKYPISEPNSSVDKNYFGKWKQENSENLYYEVSKFSDLEYKIIEVSISVTDSSVYQTIYSGHITSIKDIIFLNIKDSENPDANYLLYKIDFMSDKEITLTGITDYIKKEFNSSEELKSYIEKNMYVDYFFQSENKYYKK